jgi:hypothetical protein
MLYDAEAFAPALGFLHFGKRLASPEEVRRSATAWPPTASRSSRSGEEPEYVGVKCRDPDGYVVEASWEP